MEIALITFNLACLATILYLAWWIRSILETPFIKSERSIFYIVQIKLVLVGGIIALNIIRKGTYKRIRGKLRNVLIAQTLFLNFCEIFIVLKMNSNQSALYNKKIKNYWIFQCSIFIFIFLAKILHSHILKFIREKFSYFKLGKKGDRDYVKHILKEDFSIAQFIQNNRNKVMELSLNNQEFLMLENFFRTTYKAENKSKSNHKVDPCGLCFEIFEISDFYIPHPGCEHKFHTRCLKPWLINQNYCPLCKSNCRINLLFAIHKIKTKRQFLDASDFSIEIK